MSRVLRQRINQLFRTDADFEAFCCDEYPLIQQRFSHGMDRVTKVNLLLQVLSDHAQLSSKLDALAAPGAAPGAAPPTPTPSGQELTLLHLKQVCARLL